MRGSTAALAGAVLLGALNTLGDWIWAHYVPGHRVVFGLTHGLVLMTGLGLYLGVVRGRPGPGAAGGGGIGLGAALLFYLLARVLGYSAMFVAWMALWLGFAFLDARVLRRTAGAGEAVRRGVLAAAASGLAFYAVSGIWLSPAPGGPDYAYHFLCWTLAFLPGLLALLVSPWSDARTRPT